MASERTVHWQLCRLHGRLLLAQPMNLLALLALTVSSTAMPFVQTIESGPQLAIRCLLQVAIPFIGAMMMANQLCEDPHRLELLYERGAALPFGRALTWAHAGLWFALALPAIVSALHQGQARSWDALLQLIILAALTATMAYVAYGLTHLSRQRRLHEVGPWTAPVLVFVYSTLLLAAAICLIGLTDTLLAQEALLTLLGLAVWLTSRSLVRLYLSGLPRRHQQDNKPGTHSA